MCSINILPLYRQFLSRESIWDKLLQLGTSLLVGLYIYIPLCTGSVTGPLQTSYEQPTHESPSVLTPVENEKQQCLDF